MGRYGTWGLPRTGATLGACARDGGQEGDRVAGRGQGAEHMHTQACPSVTEQPRVYLAGKEQGWGLPEGGRRGAVWIGQQIR